MKPSRVEDCTLVSLRKVRNRSVNITVVEGETDLPFHIRRAYYLYDVPSGAERGGHAHHNLMQLLVAVSGSFDVVLDDGFQKKTVHLCQSDEGLLIVPGIWRRLENFSSCSVCLVLASEKYDEADYIRNYLSFKGLKNRQAATETIRIERYDSTRSSEWDKLVRLSQNGTFLLERSFMDYHADRFTDCSYLVYRKSVLEAVLPGNCSGDTWYSHQGLTYGGLIVGDRMRFVDVAGAFQRINADLYERGIRKVVYKPIPLFYHRQPFQEDLYLLFRFGAVRTACTLSSTLFREQKRPFSKSRRFGVEKSRKLGMQIVESDRFDLFWPILTENLQKRHGLSPVHSLEEIVRLHRSFPANIKLHLSLLHGEVLAGTVLFLTNRVVHVQYMSASEEGRTIGALDGLFDELIYRTYANAPCIDFGVSTEQGGKVLNEGLLFQKEGFGTGGTVYETYEYTLEETGLAGDLTV